MSGRRCQVSGVRCLYGSAMKAYIALSRVQTTDSLLIPEPFSPTLFQQGPQPWPTLLKEAMRTAMDDDDIYARCQRLVDQLKEQSGCRCQVSGVRCFWKVLGRLLRASQTDS